MSLRRPSGGQPSREWIIAGVVLALACGVVGGVIAYAIDSPSSRSASPSTSVAGAPASCSVAAVAKKDLPSVVTITVTSSAGTATGSGSIIRSDGYILTNNHVIAGAASGGSISVLFSDGRSAAATIVGRDPLTDIGVIKVSGESGLRAISLGSSSAVLVGEPVIAFGAPLGLSSTVTSGIVSALDRTIAVEGENSRPALLMDALQTDAAINPGNSGGALVNCSGQLIGVPSANVSVPSSSGESNGGNIGLGFAIPVDLAQREAEEIISTGRVSHAYFGIDAVPVASDASPVNGVAEGLYVRFVDAGGPAQAAGLRAGDIIKTIDGTPAVSTDQLVALTLRKHAGDVVVLGYERDGAKRTARVTLKTQPA